MYQQVEVKKSKSELSRCVVGQFGDKTYLIDLAPNECAVKAELEYRKQLLGDKPRFTRGQVNEH